MTVGKLKIVPKLLAGAFHGKAYWDHFVFLLDEAFQEVIRLCMKDSQLSAAVLCSRDSSSVAALHGQLQALVQARCSLSSCRFFTLLQLGPMLCCAVLCCAALCCAVLRCAALCCAVLCCAVLCCAVLWCVTSLAALF